MKQKLEQLWHKFEGLPPAGKIAIAVLVGLLIFGISSMFGKREKSATLSADDATYYYPYADEEGSGSTSGGESGGGNGGGSSGGVSYDEFYNELNNFYDWADSAMQSFGDQKDPTLNVPAGLPKTVVSGREGEHSYTLQLTGDGSKTIYKDGRLINESDYGYIPQEFGGTRSTGAGLGNPRYSNPDAALQQAQAAYGNAKTAAERNKAAAAGEAARNAGATDSGANKIWKSGSSSSSSSNSNNANAALQQAQAAYGSATTAAERNAAAAAGEAARKAGATDSGADKIWKSNK